MPGCDPERTSDSPSYVGSAGQRQVCGDFTTLYASAVDAKSPRAKRCDLEQSTGHHHILEEVDHLVRVSKIAVEGCRSGERKKRERNSGQTSPETHDEQNAATNLQSDSKSEGNWRQGQTRGTDHFGGRPNCCEFAEA